jgi:hypothetical protein
MRSPSGKYQYPSLIVNEEKRMATRAAESASSIIACLAFLGKLSAV